MRKKRIAIMLYINLMWQVIKDYIKPFLNIRFVISFGIAWMITNGWSYIFVAVGGALDIKWMLSVGLGYQAFLWLPITPEKLVTIPLAVIIHRLLFPKDYNSITTLNNMLNKEKAKLKT